MGARPGRSKEEEEEEPTIQAQMLWLLPLVSCCKQGDQMFLLKNRPKSRPTIYCHI
jgi:hypothetical protein